MQSSNKTLMEGAYSKRFRQLGEQHVQHLRQASTNERGDVITRNKRLQSETNRRRKAQAIKRKLEAQREEQRRQEILAHRREEQHEATERFQRGNKTVRHRVHSAGVIRHETGNTPTLEEALSAVRGAQGQRSDRDVVHRRRAMSAKNMRESRFEAEHSEHIDRPYVQNYMQQSHLVDSNRINHSRVDTQKGSAQSDLHSHSLRNLSSSRSLFEQQLEQHQQLLLQQQQQSLQQFNQAIKQEMEDDLHEQDVRALGRSDSLSSVDSLEANRNGGIGTEIEDNAYHGSHAASQPVLNGARHDMSNATQNNNGATMNSFYMPRPADTMHTIDNYSAVSKNDPRGYGHQVGGAASQVDYDHNKQVITRPYQPYPPPHPPPATSLHHHYTSTASTHSQSPSRTYSPSTSNVSVAPITRGYTSPTNVAVVQPNNAQVSDDLETDAYKQPKSVNQVSGTVATPVSYKSSYPCGNVNNASSSGNDKGVAYSQSASTNQKALNHSALYQTGSSSGYSSIVSSGMHSAGNNQTYVVASTVTEPPHHTLSRGHVTGAKPGMYTDDLSVYKARNVPCKAWASPQHEQYANSKTPEDTQSKADSRDPALTQSSSQVRGQIGTTEYSIKSPAATADHVVFAVAPPSTKPLMDTVDAMVTRTKSSAVSQASQKSQYQRSAHREVPKYKDDQKSSSEEESVGEEEEMREEQKPKVLKGILKKPGGSGKLGIKGMKAHAGNMLRDSLEVARSHLTGKGQGVKKVTHKRNVRFADEVEENEEDMVEERPYVAPAAPGKEPSSNTNALSGGQKVRGKTRPASAKVTTTTPKAEPSVRESRSASAGTTRRGPFIRPHPPPGKPQSAARSNMYNHANSNNHSKRSSSAPSDGENTVAMDTWTSGPVSSNSDGHGQMTLKYSYKSGARTVPASTEAGRPEKDVSKKDNAVYDQNGIRLDRTPTDDEINWLWEKVRTCLNKNGTSSSTSRETNERPPVSSTKTLSLAQKTIDGNSLAPQFQATTRVSAATPSTASNGHTNTTSNSVYTNRDGGTSKIPKRVDKISMDKLNTYSQRVLYSQKKQQTTTAPSSHSGTMKTSSNTRDYQSATYQGPRPSVHVPGHGNTNGHHEGVSESLAGFLAAEKLAQQSVTDSELERAVVDTEQRQQMHNTGSRPSQKGTVPSTLSLEEQRLMQSLERLNDRLRAITDAAGVGPTGMFVPRPPAYQYSGFKGRQPIMTQRKLSITSANTIPRNHYRTLPTDTSSIQAQYTAQYK